MYHYKDCGLDNVWLKNGYAVHQTPYGGGIAIEDIKGLHTAIAQQLISCRRKLSGKEFRFLRQYLEMTQKSLGDIWGKTEQAIALWEKNDKVPPWADGYLRFLVTGSLDGNKQVKELIDFLNQLSISNLSNDRDTRWTFTDTDNGWTLNAA